MWSKYTKNETMEMTKSSGTFKATYHNAMLYIIIVICKEKMANEFP